MQFQAQTEVQDLGQIYVSKLCGLTFLCHHMVCALPAIGSRIRVEQPYSDNTKKIMGKITLMLGVWDNGSVGKVFITQAWGPQLIPRTRVKIWVWQWVPVISVLERDRQEESWGLLASQHRQSSKLQVQRGTVSHNTSWEGRARKQICWVKMVSPSLTAWVQCLEPM